MYRESACGMLLAYGQGHRRPLRDTVDYDNSICVAHLRRKRRWQETRVPTVGGHLCLIDGVTLAHHPKPHSRASRLARNVGSQPSNLLPANIPFDEEVCLTHTLASMHGGCPSASLGHAKPPMVRDWGRKNRLPSNKTSHGDHTKRHRDPPWRRASAVMTSSPRGLREEPREYHYLSRAGTCGGADLDASLTTAGDGPSTRTRKVRRAIQ